MNRENMTKLALFLEDLPSERFDINHWITDLDNDTTGHELSFDNCGTAGCIAGWALCLKNNGKVTLVDDSYDDEMQDFQDHEIDVSYVRTAAANWLGINILDSDRLFYTDRYSLWYQYREDYGLEPISEENIWISDIHPKHAADMIYRLLIGDVEF